MKTIIKITLAALFLLLENNVIANDNSIIISGDLTGYPELKDGEIFQCRVIQKNAFQSWISFTDIFRDTITDRKVHLEIPVTDDYFYINFSVIHQDKSHTLINAGNSGDIPFLFEKGDNVRLTFNGSHVTFSGKGSEKLNCQYEIQELAVITDEHKMKLSPSARVNDYKTYYSLFIELVQENLERKLAILDGCRRRFNKTVYKYLYYDCIGRQLGGIYHFFETATKLKDAEQRLEAIENSLDKIELRYGGFKEKEAVYSIYYAYYLFNREKWNLYGGNRGNGGFKAYYDAVIKQFDGAIRDKLLLFGFVEFLGEMLDLYVYPEKAMQLMMDEPGKSMLEDWCKRNMPNSVAYAFSLPGLDGNRYELANFKGKVIVADFWFTGCRGCTQIPAVLKEVIDHFRERKDIMYLSINVDPNREMWVKSSEEGIYTLPEQLELSTYESRRGEHPLLMHYNIISYPHLLVIDKNGRIASTAVPDPRRDKGKALIEIINNLIK